MIYEKRTYTLNPLKMADWLALYKSDAYAVQTEHLGKLIGFFFTEIGVVNQVVHIWAYESLDDRTVRRARMAQDERWLTFSRKTANWRPLSGWSRSCCVLLIFHHCNKGPEMSGHKRWMCWSSVPARRGFPPR